MQNVAGKLEKPPGTCDRLPAYHRVRSFSCWLQACVAMLGCWICLGATSLEVQAGCHYGDGRSFLASSEPVSPHAHARNFRFLGQWIYEGGEIKYVSWQGSSPCHGPNCQAQRKPQSQTHAPVPTTQRLTQYAVDSPMLSFQSGNSQFLDWTSGSPSPFAGYPHEHEYPP